MNLIMKLEMDPDDQDARDELVKSEIFYMKDRDDLGLLYTKNYWP